MKGKSLSFCVADICRGKVALDDVEIINSGTCAVSESDWRKLVDHYCEFYWKDFPEQAREVVATLRASNRIYQPREYGFEPANISAGHWE